MDRGFTTSEPSTKRAEPGVVAQFIESAAYTGAEAPLRAVAQIADHFAGTHADAAVQADFKALGVEKPQSEQFGHSGWYAEQLGSAVGMAIPFMALRSGIGRLSGAETAAASLEGATPGLMQLATREAALSGAAGLAYGTLLSPSEAKNVSTSKFYADRLGGGLTDMASFGALGFASPYIGAGLEATAGKFEASSLPSLVKTPLAATLRFPVVTGMAAGVPGGIANAETNAWKDGRLLASGQEIKQSVIGMSFVGGTLGAAPLLLDGGSHVSAADRQAFAASDTRWRSMPDEKGTQTGDKTSPSKSAMPVEKSGSTPDQAPVPTDRTPTEAELKDAMERALGRVNLKRASGTEDVAPEASLINKLAAATGKRHNMLASVENVDPAQAKAVRDALKPSDPPVPGMEVVLGASGIEAPAHAGFLQALEERHVPIGRVTGASGGSLVATLFANKYSPEQIKDILLSDDFRYPKPSVLAQCLHLYDPWNLYPYSIDFRPWLKDFVETYKLKPQPNLRIVAADGETHAPVVFEGTNYDLVTALAASTAAKTGMNMKPVQYDGRELIDGFYYHPTPSALSKPPALVSKIGFVHELPSEPLAPWDYLMHLREMSYYEEFKRDYPDPPGHIIATTGLPDVATTTMGVSHATLEKLVTHGHDATIKRLSEPDAVKAIKKAQRSQQK